ncbi:TusE/DsrC/DsvC family sulfur relay protein [Moraxella osloensis]|uniref:Sulfurtransferase n=1 Tax=Faucicola osloensis TaxID=34062 RepID=A0A2D2LU03_FAUOS|nr:TusE/DsrC/DsvC family sulfur relay protein [Moraxella osloensis]ATR78509.1 sulfite reductase [Moraxella osloensis]
MTQLPHLDQAALDQAALDQDGHLIAHQTWTPDIAQQLANTLDVTLTPEHYQIIDAVRQYYDLYSHPPTTRPLIKFLSKQLPSLAIDNTKLQAMFNTGLVARHVNRIAGLPKPANCL